MASPYFNRSHFVIGDTSRETMLHQLTTRELEIAHLVSAGLSNKGIANVLGSCEGTIKVHMHNIFQKLGIEKRTELAVMIANALHATKKGEDNAILANSIGR